MFKTLSTAAKLALGAAALALIAFAAWWVVIRPQQAAQTAATAKGSQVQAEAAAGAAQDTVRIVVDRGENRTRIDRITEEKTRVIMAQPGADAPLDPALHDAGIRALCLRDGQSDVLCQELLHRDGGVDEAGGADPARDAARQ